MNGGALLLGVAAVLAGVGYARLVGRTIAARGESEQPDQPAEDHAGEPWLFRPLSTRYLRFQRGVGYGAAAVGALLILLSPFG